VTALNITLHLATEYTCDHQDCPATILVHHHHPNTEVPANAYTWEAEIRTNDTNTCRNANQLALNHWKTTNNHHYCPDHQPPAWDRTGTPA
jgi:hypothetical protein